MNIYTVRMATQGIANYLAKIGISEPSAAIAFDNRNMLRCMRLRQLSACVQMV